MVTFRTFLTATLALAGALGLAGPARADFGFAINFVVNPYAAGVGDSWLFGINNQGQATGYTATTVGLVEKNIHGYVKIQRAILEMRRSGRIPWRWIVDTGRWSRKPKTWGID